MNDYDYFMNIIKGHDTKYKRMISPCHFSEAEYKELQEKMKVNEEKYQKAYESLKNFYI